MRLSRSILWLGLGEMGLAMSDEAARSYQLQKRQSSTPESEDFVRMVDTGIAAVDNRLWIAGGTIVQYVDWNGDDPYVAFINRTLALPLDEDWDIADVEIISLPPNSKYQQVSGHSVVAGRSSGRDRVWSWGGRTDKPKAALYVYTPDNGDGEWRTETVPDSITRGEYGAGTSCKGSMVYFGGRARNNTDDSVRNLDDSSSIALPGVITYDFEEGTWTNSSSEGWLGRATFQKGELICASVGDMDPVVLAIGGGSTPATGVQDSSTRMLEMSTVWIWDMDGRRWHRQSTVGGRVPPERQSFCAVGAPSQNGTYEIFIYGGLDEDANPLDDVWILSLPGFRWFQTDASSTARFDHKCHRSGDQMINVGGDDIPHYETVDELNRGIGVFNLTSLEWQDKYVADTEYDSPAMVKEWYSNGGLDDLSWENDQVKSFFMESNGGNDNKGGGSGNDGQSGGEEEEKDQDSGNDTPVGAIAGGVVGGVALLALAGFLFWFLRRRRRNQDTHADTTPEMPASEVLSPGKDGRQTWHQGYYEQGHYQYSPSIDNRAELGPSSAMPPVEMDAGEPLNRTSPPSGMASWR